MCLEIKRNNFFFPLAFKRPGITGISAALSKNG
jgi:hypothetical protein